MTCLTILIIKYYVTECKWVAIFFPSSGIKIFDLFDTPVLYIE